MKTKLLLITSVLLFSIIIGCSSESNPATPSDDFLSGQPLSGQPLVGVSDRFSDGSPASGMGALGIFNLSVNTDDISAELTPIRQNSLTDVLEVVDITNFLQMAPCSDCAKIGSISIDINGNLVVSIGLKHPFPAGDMMKPISGKNRGDLHVFNIEGTIVSDTLGTSFYRLGKATAGFTLLNADGYTPYLDTVLDGIYPTDASVHPYILHFDDYTAGNFDAANPMGFESVTDPPPSGNLIMAMGCDYDYQDYVLNIDGDFDFIYAVGCTYAVSSASKDERFTPEYRSPQHNKKAASEISIEIITNDLKGEDALSSADIEIYVVDISHDVAVGTNLDEMFTTSSVDDILIDVPGVTSDLVVVDGNNPVSGTGHDPADPLVYEATITNTASGAEGTYIGLVKVSDNYATGLNENVLLNGMDGIQRVDPIDNPLTGLFDIAEFATYQTFTIDVAPGNDRPVAILIPDPDPANIYQFSTIDFDGTTSYDTDGTITLYEFDYDWDGVEANFFVEDSNITGLAISPSYDTVGTFTTGLRVTDDLGAFGFDSVTVDVAEITAIFVDDSNTTGVEDGTQANPYNTIQEGLAAATAGEQVWVDDSGNDYIGPITLVADVILLSTNWDDSDGDEQADIRSGSPIVTGAQDATIDGFKIYGSGYGIRVNGVDTNILNCLVTEIVSNSARGISIENSTKSLVEGCEISVVRSSGGSWITIIGLNVSNCTPSGSDHVIIRQNFINTIYSTGLLGGSYVTVIGMDVSNSEYVEVKNNTVYNIDGGNYYNIYGVRISGSDNSSFINNVISDVRKNYYYGNAYGVHISGMTTIDCRNNIVYHITKSFPSQRAYGVSAPAGITWEYSDINDTNNESYVGGITAGVGCINANPLFVNLGVDFHLLPGSPCIDTGDPAIFDPDSSRSDMGCHGGPGGDW